MVPVSANPAAPSSGDHWTGLCPDEIDVASVHEWLVRPDCGGVVVFSGTARDHAGDRTGVESLTYENKQLKKKIAAMEKRLAELEKLLKETQAKKKK